MCSRAGTRGHVGAGSVLGGPSFWVGLALLVGRSGGRRHGVGKAYLLRYVGI